MDCRVDCLHPGAVRGADPLNTEDGYISHRCPHLMIPELSLD
jgi:hypothetical protein